jgi:hypothetical protein
MRMLDWTICDATPPREEDCDEGVIPSHYLATLSPVTQQERLYLVESFKLATLG